jgi:hypothetical protein
LRCALVALLPEQHRRNSDLRKKEFAWLWCTELT